ncbi:hypothetical protein GCL60_00565 [Silvanigrella paludirubra]|uniref:Tetratricopeptide repeat protein n=1 Tax=Silvanigrella paludirubra TaxID=2499159 RepID=A0A6N6VV29_9BACT|nr:tetratricopeptide repeat protein [Silvanigrella paludirubra]KAB8040440.1 hypothetical protein GCL60_00565 [Silvanigrella paludirubra]
MKNKILYFSIFNILLLSHLETFSSVNQTSVTSNKKVANSNIENSYKIYREAKSILINALPGEQLKAEKLLVESIRLNPKNIDAYIELSRLIQQQVSQGYRHPYELQKSIELITEANELDPNRPKALFAKADILYYSGQPKAAEDLYVETLTKLPDHLDSYIEKGRIFSERNPKESLLNIELALKKGANTDDISQSAATAISRLSKPNELGFALKEFALKYPDRWIWHKAALAFINIKNYNEATLCFEKAILLGNDVESRLQLSVMQYSLQNKNKVAIYNLNKLITTISKRKYISPSALSLVYAHLSMANFKDKNIEDASVSAIYSAETGNDNKQFYASLVSEYKKLNALYVLEGSLKYLIKEEPDYMLPYSIYGEIYRNLKKYEDSIEMYNKALALDNTKDDLFADRAITFYKNLDYTNALNDFESALKIRPHTAIYIYNKACMLALLGKKSEALQNLKLALIEDKKLIELARFDSDFASIKSDSEYSSQFASLILDDADDKLVATDTGSK